MGFQAWFRAPPTRAAGRALFAAASSQARVPGLYAALGAPDTLEGRFETATLHTLLLLRRLKGEGPEADATSQALVDAFMRWLDDGLREMGVGDTSVAKKIRKLASAFQGRLQAYDAALDALPDESPLRIVIARTVLGEADEADAGRLATYAARAMATLEAQPLAELLDGRAAWPEAAQ